MRSSASAAAQTTIERQLSTDTAANYRPEGDAHRRVDWPTAPHFRADGWKTDSWTPDRSPQTCKQLSLSWLLELSFDHRKVPPPLLAR
jgi:hypothetical protein